jgi:diacylglycerol kinase (ATP)
MKNVCENGKRILLIINPNAGKTKSMSTLSDILDVFAKNVCTTKSFSTKKKNDATDIVKKHAKDYDVVVCCGGDGTLNEVINGIMSLEKPLPIGYIPTGTSNDFATSLGLSTDIEKAAQDVIDGKYLPHDIGSLNDESYFSYVASFGTMSDVSYLTSQKMKNLFGHFAYTLEGAKVFFKMHAYHAKIEYDNKTIEGDFILGGVSNSKSIGGMLKLKNKDIVLNDGIFELIFIRKPNNARDVANIAKWLFTQNENNSSIVFEHASSAVISAEDFIPWTVDGEFAGHHKRVEIKNRHHAINFLSPK